MRHLRAVGVLAAALVLTACSAASVPLPTPTVSSPRPSSTSPSPAPTTPTPTGSPSDGAQAADAVIARIGDAQWARIVAAGMARPGCPLGRADLRRVEVNHWTFDGTVSRGVVVVNRDVAPDIAAIFTRLFDEGFPIRSMKPLEEFGGDNEKSMAADNTGAFNCRTDSQTNAPLLRSPHANGRAIDVNPVENPWQDPRCAPCWSPTDTYGTVRTGPGVITEKSVAWQAFVDEGWIWEDIDVADYMHFDTGYPSVPWDAAKGRPKPTPTPSPVPSVTRSATPSPS